jgi:hypothetical protein
MVAVMQKLKDLVDRVKQQQRTTTNGAVTNGGGALIVEAIPVYPDVS